MAVRDGDGDLERARVVLTERALHGEAFNAKVLPRVPMRRWGVGGDFGGIAVYLTSDASAYHSGDTFVIDGGYLIF